VGSGGRALTKILFLTGGLSGMKGKKNLFLMGEKQGLRDRRSLFHMGGLRGEGAQIMAKRSLQKNL
jgi:hypothetical protein